MNHGATIFVLIFLGSALGGGIRYGISGWIGRYFGGRFPAGTMLINVTGAFGAGFVWALAGLDMGGSPVTATETFLLLGFFGGYTTVSANVLSAVTLMQEGEPLRAGLDLFGTFFLCLLAVVTGAMAGGVL